MGKIIDITNKRFGRLTVTNFEYIKDHKTYWRCKCGCGKSSIVYKDSLMSKKTTSCGCVAIESARKLRYIHGMTGSRFHEIWLGIISRCEYKSSSIYKKYGGNGIKICFRWKNFLNFKKDMYEKYLEHSKDNGEKNTTIDRINNKKGYSPDNCRWATWLEQGNNTSRNIFIEFNGKKQTISQWARHLNINRDILRYRIQKGWTKEKIFSAVT